MSSSRRYHPVKRVRDPHCILGQYCQVQLVSVLVLRLASRQMVMFASSGLDVNVDQGFDLVCYTTHLVTQLECLNALNALI